MSYPFAIRVIGPSGASYFVSHFLDISLTQVFEDRMVFLTEEIADDYRSQVADSYKHKGFFVCVVNTEDGE